MTEIYYTGDLTTPDGSDVDGYYGEPVEPGTGYTYESGWVDPDWSTREVHAEREHVRPDTFDPADGVPLIDWIAERLDARLYVIDETSNAGESTYYSGEADTDPYSGQSIRLAAHIHGASDEILRAVGYRLAFERARYRSGI